MAMVEILRPGCGSRIHSIHTKNQSLGIQGKRKLFKISTKTQVPELLRLLANAHYECMTTPHLGILHKRLHVDIVVVMGHRGAVCTRSVQLDALGKAVVALCTHLWPATTSVAHFTQQHMQLIRRISWTATLLGS